MKYEIHNPHAAPHRMPCHASSSTWAQCCQLYEKALEYLLVNFLSEGPGENTKII
jgi:hypothetical protein